MPLNRSRMVTEVMVRLFPALGATRLEVTHSGWGDGPDWERARTWFDRAWAGSLEKLRTLFHPGATDAGRS